ncbi:MAG: hypothetical protein QOJ13_2323 [Gaiellales bacterium]|nr:hypothetical protein [Gaiellales bacterium]
MLSSAGSMFSWVALPVLTYQLTSSPVWTGAVAASSAVPYLALGLMAGVVADRRSRRKLMAYSDLASGAILTGVFVLSRVGTLHPAEVVAAALTVQSLFVFFDAANFGALPALVGRDWVLESNSVLYSVMSVVETTAPPLAGALLLVTDAPALLLVDAASFVASSWLIYRLPSSLEGDRARGALSWRVVRREAVAALRYIRDTRPIRATTVGNACICVVTGGFAGQLIVWANQRLSASPGELSLSVVFVTWTLGDLVGAAGVTMLARRLGPLAEMRALITGTLIFGAALLTSQSLWMAVPLTVAWGACSTGALITGVSLRQSVSPERMVSTINTAGRMLTLGIGYPLGALVAGYLAARYDAAVVGMGACLLALLPALAVLRSADSIAEPATAVEGLSQA